MKILKYILISFILIIICFVAFTDNATKDKLNIKKLEPSAFNINDSSNNLIQKITFNELNNLIQNMKGSKHLYLFSYFCSPCRNSLSKKSYNKVRLNDKDFLLPTILVSCDNYGTLDKLQAIANENNLKHIYILDNNEFVSTSNFGTYDRLENILKTHYSKGFDNRMLGFPYNVILDSTNNIIGQYLGAIVN